MILIYKNVNILLVQKFLKMKRIVIEISFGEVGEEEVILTQNLYLKEEGEKEKHKKMMTIYKSLYID